MNEVFVKKINSGAFSNIYRVSKEPTADKIQIRVNTDRPIAIKASCLETGSREYELMRQMDHKHLIPALVGYYDNQLSLYVIAMPLYAGDLVEFKQYVNFPAFLAQMIDAVQHMHQVGIVHCDIKPQNILIRSPTDHTYSLIDFNTAYVYRCGRLHKRFNPNYDSKTIVGTLNFCSIFAIFYCTPFRRDDMESLFLTCLFLNSDIDESIFLRETNIEVHRKFRLCLDQYRTVQSLRAHKFYDAIDYASIKTMIMDDLNIQ